MTRRETVKKAGELYPGDFFQIKGTRQSIQYHLSNINQHWNERGRHFVSEKGQDLEHRKIKRII
jgi:hypothetical protein